jgi:hypothetical protein
VQSKSVRPAHYQSSHPETFAIGKSDFFDSIGQNRRSARLAGFGLVPESDMHLNSD